MIGEAAAVAHINQREVFGHFCGLDDVLTWSVFRDDYG